ncbi:MAG: hypothetical protein AAFX78_06435 [Cyanobacteria bacterium J06638_20]
MPGDGLHLLNLRLGWSQMGLLREKLLNMFNHDWRSCINGSCDHWSLAPSPPQKQQDSYHPNPQVSPHPVAPFPRLLLHHAKFHRYSCCKPSEMSKNGGGTGNDAIAQPFIPESFKA